MNEIVLICISVAASAYFTLNLNRLVKYIKIMREEDDDFPVWWIMRPARRCLFAAILFAAFLKVYFS